MPWIVDVLSAADNCQKHTGAMAHVFSSIHQCPFRFQQQNPKSSYLSTECHVEGDEGCVVKNVIQKNVCEHLLCKTLLSPLYFDRFC